MKKLILLMIAVLSLVIVANAADWTMYGSARVGDLDPIAVDDPWLMADTYQYSDDFDGDGIEDEKDDNCPFLGNPAPPVDDPWLVAWGDTYQYADDFDGDGLEDDVDNCPYISNPAAPPDNDVIAPPVDDPWLVGFLVEPGDGGCDGTKTAPPAEPIAPPVDDPWLVAPSYVDPEKCDGDVLVDPAPAIPVGPGLWI